MGERKEGRREAGKKDRQTLITLGTEQGCYRVRVTGKKKQRDEKRNLLIVFPREVVVTH